MKGKREKTNIGRVYKRQTNRIRITRVIKEFEFLTEIKYTHCFRIIIIIRYTTEVGRGWER